MYISSKRSAIAILLPFLAIGGCATTDQDQLLALQARMAEVQEQTAQEEEENNTLKTEISKLQSDLASSIEEGRVTMNELQNKAVVSLDANILFQTGTADLSKDGRVVVEKISTTFKRYPGYHMRIEGHTDNLPIGSKLKQHYRSNWELSAARAAAVVHYLTFSQKVPAASLSIAGFGSERPIASNETAEGRSMNRRINVVVFKPEESTK